MFVPMIQARVCTSQTPKTPSICSACFRCSARSQWPYVLAVISSVACRRCRDSQVMGLPLVVVPPFPGSAIAVLPKAIRPAATTKNGNANHFRDVFYSSLELLTNVTERPYNSAGLLSAARSVESRSARGQQ